MVNIVYMVMWKYWFDINGILVMFCVIVIEKGFI